MYVDGPWDKKLLLTAAGIALLPIIAAVFFRAPAPPPLPDEKSSGSRVQVDTYIPRGFVLVPIEVQNYEALDSILGNYGVVDLFQGGSPSGGKQHLVARNVRMLRAPQNPAHFAILVGENEVSEVLKYGSSFTVILKRQDKAGTQFVKEQKPVHRPIIYEGDS